jgi:predicted CXXCH cytochrome family protein
VRDQECQACHSTTGRHVAPGKVQPAFFPRTRCATCHPEHGSDVRPIKETDALCVACHADIHRQMENTTLRNVSGFGADDRHPEFQILVPTTGSAACERITIAQATSTGPQQPREDELVLHEGLRFPHALHVQKDLRTKWVELPPSKMVSLGCPDCHVPENGGALMRPIRFNEHCQQCHDLRFSDAFPDRQVSHPSQPAAVEADVFQFFAARALTGERTGPASPPTRRRPGAVLSEQERLNALAWAQKEAAYAKDDLLGKHGIDAKSGNRGACAICHAFTADGSAVVPVARADTPGRCGPAMPRNAALPGVQVDATESRWMDFTTFSHEAHRSKKCEYCHRIENAATSPTGMLPGRATCVECHHREPGGPRQALDACIQCHRMHIERYGPMHGGDDGARTSAFLGPG